jgi:hypothetical protein
MTSRELDNIESYIKNLVGLNKGTLLDIKKAIRNERKLITGRNCFTCKHEDLDIRAMPCMGCIHGSGDGDYWEKE